MTEQETSNKFDLTEDLTEDETLAWYCYLIGKTEGSIGTRTKRVQEMIEDHKAYLKANHFFNPNSIIF